MKEIIIKSDSKVKFALEILSKTGFKSLIIADDEKLSGTLSDGDLRKALLKGVAVTDSISNIYNKKPFSFLKDKFTLEEAKKVFLEQHFDLIPIVNTSNKLIDVLFWKDVFEKHKEKKFGKLDLSVVIMAGGKGTRLEPFTKVLPKPLIPINEKTVIEHIIESFVKAGAKDFYLTVNYKSILLKAFFQELKPNYSINFVDEKEPLGTAGSLYFLKNKFIKPFIVSNSDILIKLDYSNLYNFHKQNKNDITLVASTKNYIIPYGSCELDSNGNLLKITEKPSYNFLANTGLYILNPDILDLIPDNKLYHMTSLISDARKKNKKIGVFPVNEDVWIDIGQWVDYEKNISKF